MAITLTIVPNDAANISAENLPESRTLTAIGTDSNDNAAVFNYSWLILDKPVGSTATLSSATGNGISLEADVWGTYRVFCIAENRDTGEVSQADPLRAPQEAFYNIQVESVKYDLEKPAKGQRNWHPQYRHLVDVVENLAGAGPATYVAGGTVEIATPVDIAQGPGPQDSSSGEHYLAVSTEDLHTALHPTANGQLGAGQANILRNTLKGIALEQINESSISELKDVDTTSQAPTAGQALVWSPTHVDDTNGDVGAWIPGDVAGSSNLFGAGLCAGETLDTGDILIYREDCQEVPVAGAIPGWHARNRYNGQEFALNFAYASPGRAGAAYMATAEANSLGTWDDNREAVGQVAIASIYNTARARAYDADVYSTSAQITAALNVGQLPAFAMSPLHFAQCLIGQSFAGPSGTINNVVVDTNKDGETIALYDPGYHTAAEIADLVADAQAGQTFDGVAINLIQQALSAHHLLRLGRSSITRLLDVDTTTHAPVDNDFLVWDSAHADDGGQGTGAWVPKSAAELGLSGGVSTLDKIEEGNTLVEVIDNSTDGHIVFQTEGTERWHIETGGHLIPQANCTYDIGEAENKVRHFYLSNNSLKFGPSDTTTISAEFGVDADGGNTPQWTANSTTYTMPTYTGTPVSDQILKFIGGQWTLAADQAGGVDGLTSNLTDTVSIDSGYKIAPSQDGTQDLGSTSLRFGKVYANEVVGYTASTDNKYTKLSLNANIPGTPGDGLKAAALYSRGSIAMMIDTNNAGSPSTSDPNNSFVVYEGSEDDETATERFRVENDGQVRINNAYYLPTADGSSGQILQTNGSGQLSFVNNTASSSIEGTFDQCHLGAFTDEITYNQSGYTVGVGRSPVMFMFRNPYDVSLNLKEFTFSCTHMHSSTLNFSFAICTHAQLLQNIYQTNSSQFTLTKVNIDPNTNNEGIGSLEGQIGNQLQAGEYLVVLLNGFEKTGQDNERFFINIEYTD